MTLRVLIDNSGPLPDRLRELVGVDRFAKLIFKRRTLAATIEQAAAAAGLEPPDTLDSHMDWARLAEQLQGEEQSEERFLVCPAGVVAGRGSKALIAFLQQARYSPQNLVLPARGGPEWGGWALMTSAVFGHYLNARAQGNLANFFECYREQFVRLDGRLDLIDLSDEVTLLEFLSGTFDARSFNAVESHAYTVTKTSVDKAKLDREFRYHQMLPESMQMFFVRPFDFIDLGKSAIYTMERLFVPDMAVQWLHGALTEIEFRRFLDQIFCFVSSRAKRAAAPGEAENVIETLLVEKVRDRVEALKGAAAYQILRPLIDRACGSLDDLVGRYLALFGRMRRQLPTDTMVIGHGDLCFSNILYAKTNRTMKLIDPRGAASEADLWTHPYYDLAKLSHSILGNYDFVNQGMFDIHIDEDLRLRLVIDRPPPAWASTMFLGDTTRAGFSPNLVRLCEASLFISMLPLHIDRPRNVLGFIVIATRILDELERSE